MQTNRVLIAALMTSVIAVGAYAQDRPAKTAPSVPMHGQKSSDMMGGMKDGKMEDMMAEDRTMMAKRQKMMSEIDAADAKLDDLMAAMSAARGDDRIDAMAKVITELVAHQRLMRHEMMSMGPEMMSHMKAHMKAGTVPGMENSMARCPMMQSSNASKEAESDHEQHHPGAKE